MKVGDKVMHGGREWKIGDIKESNAYIMDGRSGGKAKWVPYGSLGLTPKDQKLRLQEAKLTAAKELNDTCREQIKGKTVTELLDMAKQLGVNPQFIDKATDKSKSPGMQTMQLGNLLKNKMLEMHMQKVLKGN